jgi:DNA-binding NarL/FixJ family response regulator
VIRVLVVDDEALIRDGFRMILNAQDDIEVVGEAADGMEAVQLTRSLRPDLVLMDVRMPRLDGIGATQQIAKDANAPKVLMLTTFDRDEYVYEAMRAGACGFLLKTAGTERLIESVRHAVEGETALAPEISRRLVDDFMRRPLLHDPAEALQDLTAREREVLEHVARGLSNTDIGRVLFLSEATVKTYLSRILSKLDLRDRAQVVVFAYETGIVAPGDRATLDSS